MDFGGLFGTSPYGMFNGAYGQGQGFQGAPYSGLGGILGGLLNGGGGFQFANPFWQFMQHMQSQQPQQQNWMQRLRMPMMGTPAQGIGGFLGAGAGQLPGTAQPGAQRFPMMQTAQQPTSNNIGMAPSIQSHFFGLGGLGGNFR